MAISEPPTLLPLPPGLPQPSPPPFGCSSPPHAGFFEDRMGRHSSRAGQGELGTQSGWPSSDQAPSEEDPAVERVERASTDRRSGDEARLVDLEPLPSLLSHIPASSSFAVPFFPSTSNPFPLDDTTRSMPRFIRYQLAPCTCGTKRASSAAIPHPHVPDPANTKKRKVRHSHFRSEALFAGPPSPTKRPRSRSTSASTWWPSVSLSHGEGRESRFAPSEEVWTGSGAGWTSQLAQRFSSLRIRSGSSSSKRARQERSRSRSRSRGRGRDPTTTRRDRPRDVRPRMPGRAASSPSVFGVSGLKTPYTWPPTPPTTMELEGPALKKILLANLRTRMANGGSGSTAAEVGLRFAVWNAWNRRPQEPLDEVDEPEAEPAPEVHGAYDSALFSDDDDDADNPDTVDDELALPDPPAELVNEGEPADLLLASDGSSGTLDPSYDGFEAEPSTAAPPLARPTLRRTTSLPNISLGEHSDAGDSRSSSSGKYTYRQEQGQRRRSLWEASGWTFVSCGV
uniref:BY PROTMAP: gi/647402561/emb/CDR48794.1/ RHTO0S20e01508g1_1 [Rhodosporidium toruloides] n=1 Tax=Rhodotorula toruloides TaxID=5286 RepID=A0A0K3CUI9_RHOTO